MSHPPAVVHEGKVKPELDAERWGELLIGGEVKTTSGFNLGYAVYNWDRFGPEQDHDDQEPTPNSFNFSGVAFSIFVFGIISTPLTLKIITEKVVNGNRIIMKSFDLRSDNQSEYTHEMPRCFKIR